VPQHSEQDTAIQTVREIRHFQQKQRRDRIREQGVQIGAGSGEVTAERRQIEKRFGGCIRVRDNGVTQGRIGMPHAQFP
jgi:hypothetical protein